MTGTPIDLGLLRAARKELVERLLPGLEGERRYTGAMLKRALDVLLAQATAAEAPEAALVRAGFGGAVALAAALRARSVAPGPELAAALRDHVERKLEISNPRFLRESRAAKGDHRP